MRRGRKGHLLAITLFASIVIVSLITLFFSRGAAESGNITLILNAQEIKEERHKYPYVQLFPDAEDSNVSYMPTPYVNIFENTENFIQLEVLSDAYIYYEKLEGNSYRDRVVSYQARVISDINGEFKEGDEIEIATTEIVDELIPGFITGNNYIIPLNSLPSEKDNDRFFMKNLGSYYINDQGFVFSFYDVYDYDLFTGNQVDIVMRKLTLDSGR